MPVLSESSDDDDEENGGDNGGMPSLADGGEDSDIEDISCEESDSIASIASEGMLAEADIDVADQAAPHNAPAPRDDYDTPNYDGIGPTPSQRLTCFERTSWRRTHADMQAHGHR